ncbi:MAG TPA: PD-(D/E)XK nuclease superfamily protein [Candidatus Xenobia bacterium]|jgi:hypothetical protein
MVRRDSGPRKTWEDLVFNALRDGGYAVFPPEQTIGPTFLGKAHRVDGVFMVPGVQKLVLLSLKWQETPGTAEEKIPFEVIKLQSAIHDLPTFGKAFLVLGGTDTAWTLRKHYVEGALSRYLNCPDVLVVDGERFIDLARRREIL